MNVCWWINDGEVQILYLDFELTLFLETLQYVVTTDCKKASGCKYNILGSTKVSNEKNNNT